ncbi:MAG: hypothetical protein JWN76_1182 [Chitinophagaceae bacterium]|nr:hypothetical protein [Chitinophagaceae bacterium]
MLQSQVRWCINIIARTISFVDLGETCHYEGQGIVHSRQHVLVAIDVRLGAGLIHEDYRATPDTNEIFLQSLFSTILTLLKLQVN